MKKVSSLVAISLIFSAFLISCGQAKPPEAKMPEVIRIGAFEPLTGANAAGGILEKEGIALAHELYPTVTIDGVEIPVEIQYADNKSDRKESFRVARELVEEFGAHLVIGSWGSSNAIAAGPVFEKAKVPAIGATCTNPLVTLGNEYYFRVCFIDPFQGTVMAKYAYEEGGYRKVAIIEEVTSSYSVPLAQIFSNAFRELTGDENSITGVGKYRTGDRDFSVQLKAIKDSDAEAIFFPGNFTESAHIMKQARAMGITLPFLGSDVWEVPEVIEIAGEAAEGAVYSTFYDPEAPLTDMTKVFLKAYAEKYGTDEVATGVAASGFDAYLLAIRTIEKAGTVDGPSLRATLAATENFEGATGFLTLDENGDAIKPAIIKTIQEGKFVYNSFVAPF